MISIAGHSYAPEIMPEDRPADIEITLAEKDGNFVTAGPNDGDAADIHTVTLSFFGKDDIVCLTKDITLGELLDSAGVTLGENNRLKEGLDTLITEDTEIAVDEVSESSLEVWDEIPYETQYISVQNIPRGQYRLVQQGSAGMKYKLYNREIVNGEEVSRELVYETVYQPPQTEIYYVGSGGTVYKNGVAYSYSYYIDMSATYYTRASSPSQWGHLTYSGRPVDETCIAVDTSVIPLNTWVYIENPATGVAAGAVDYGKRVAADIGGGIIGNKIDIFLEDNNSVDPYIGLHGVIPVRVYILD